MHWQGAGWGVERPQTCPQRGCLYHRQWLYRLLLQLRPCLMISKMPEALLIILHYFYFVTENKQCQMIYLYIDSNDSNFSNWTFQLRFWLALFSGVLEWLLLVWFDWWIWFNNLILYLSRKNTSDSSVKEIGYLPSPWMVTSIYFFFFNVHCQHWSVYFHVL